MIVWFKRRLAPAAPIWAIIIVLILLCVFYVVAKVFGADIHAALFSSKWILAVLSELSVVGMTAIITGAILKVLLLQGYFEDALTNVIFGEAGLDRLGTERRIELWKTLTCKIHAPLLHEKIGDSRLSDLRAKLLAAEEKQISYNESFFVENIIRDIEFCWSDEQNGIVEMRAFFQSTLVPFDDSREIEWKSITTPDLGSKIDDYEINESEISIEGENAEKRKVVEEGNRKTTTYYLKGRPSYKASSKRTITWKLEKDPIYWATSPYIVIGGTFKVTNKLRGKRLIFQEIGGAEIFQILEGASVLPDGEHLRRGVADVLLPRQGFQIIIV
jgi:hypothetical protein